MAGLSDNTLKQQWHRKASSSESELRHIYVFAHVSVSMETIYTTLTPTVDVPSVYWVIDRLQTNYEWVRKQKLSITAH